MDLYSFQIRIREPAVKASDFSLQFRRVDYLHYNPHTRTVLIYGILKTDQSTPEGVMDVLARRVWRINGRFCPIEIWCTLPDEPEVITCKSFTEKTYAEMGFG